jgi:hypothetical protein
LTFGIGLSAGPWLCLDFDWRHHHIYYGGWGYRHGFVHGNSDFNHAWQPHAWQIAQHHANSYRSRLYENHRGWEGNTARRTMNATPDRAGNPAFRRLGNPAPGRRVNSADITRGLSQRAHSGQLSHNYSERTPSATRYRQPTFSPSGMERSDAFSGYHSGAMTHEYSNRGASSRSSAGVAHYSAPSGGGGFSGGASSSGASHGGGGGGGGGSHSGGGGGGRR